MQEDSFDVAVRGYNKRQVDDYVLQCQHHIRDLAQRLALAEQEAEHVRREAASQLERVTTKPVHEEVSERLGQILRLANEEAARERTNAAEEIAVLRAQAHAETHALREQAEAETEALRDRVAAEAEAVRDQARAETDALRDRVAAETDDLRRRAEQQIARDLDLARQEAERVRAEAHHAAELEVEQASARAAHAEESARLRAERLVAAAQERADAVVAEADRRATAVNAVLGARLELLTTTHSDVLTRLLDLRTVLVDALDKEDAAGPFAVVPSPAEAAAATVRSALPVEAGAADVDPRTDPRTDPSGQVLDVDALAALQPARPGVVVSRAPDGPTVVAGAPAAPRPPQVRH